MQNLHDYGTALAWFVTLFTTTQSVMINLQLLIRAERFRHVVDRSLFFDACAAFGWAIIIASWGK